MMIYKLKINRICMRMNSTCDHHIIAAGATLFAFDFGDASTFANVPRNADAVFVNTPGDIERTKLTIAGIDAAKAAGVRAEDEVK